MEKRYTLPNHQHILVHPSKTAKSGKFDCTVMSLSLLLDYRQEDSKEHSFEVSLFAELFNEMLIRDFGFNIYKALYELPEKLKEEKKDKDEKNKDEKDERSKMEKEEKSKVEKEEKSKGEKEKKNNSVDDKKGEDKKSEDEQECEKVEQEESDEKEKKEEKNKDESENDDEDDREKKRDRKGYTKKESTTKKDKVKLYTKDKHLLLSFVYFDQTHCGYIFDKDIEELLYTLGLKLSRAQIRKLVGKVVIRDSLHYRKLTDKPKEEEPAADDVPINEIDWQIVGIGNKKYMPIFKTQKTIEERQYVSTGPSKLQEGMFLIPILYVILVSDGIFRNFFMGIFKVKRILSLHCLNLHFHSTDGLEL